MIHNLFGILRTRLRCRRRFFFHCCEKMVFMTLAYFEIFALPGALKARSFSFFFRRGHIHALLTHAWVENWTVIFNNLGMHWVSELRFWNRRTPCQFMLRSVHTCLRAFDPRFLGHLSQMPVKRVVLLRFLIALHSL